MNPYREYQCESIHIDTDMSDGERLALMVVMLLNLGMMLAFLYICIFHTSFMLDRYLGIHT